jgi:hypothetical protein
MTHTDLLEAADRIGRLISSARSSLAADQDVDLCELEAGMSQLHQGVQSQRPRAASELSNRLNELLADLDALERAFIRHHTERTKA